MLCVEKVLVNLCSKKEKVLIISKPSACGVRRRDEDGGLAFGFGTQLLEIAVFLDELCLF